MKTYENVTTIRAVQYDGSGSSAIEVAALLGDVGINADEVSSEGVDLVRALLARMKIKEGDYVGMDSKGNTQHIPAVLFESVYTETGDVILS